MKIEEILTVAFNVYASRKGFFLLCAGPPAEKYKQSFWRFYVVRLIAYIYRIRRKLLPTRLVYGPTRMHIFIAHNFLVPNAQVKLSNYSYPKNHQPETRIQDTYPTFLAMGSAIWMVWIGPWCASLSCFLYF